MFTYIVVYERRLVFSSLLRAKNERSHARFLNNDRYAHSIIDLVKLCSFPEDASVAGIEGSGEVLGWRSRHLE